MFRLIETVTANACVLIFFTNEAGIKQGMIYRHFNKSGGMDFHHVVPDL